VPKTGGLLVLEAIPGGPAQRAGLKGATQILRLGNLRLPAGGDFLLAVDGVGLTDQHQFTRYLETKTRVGQKVTVRVWRKGKQLEMRATLGERYQRPLR